MSEVLQFLTLETNASSECIHYVGERVKGKYLFYFNSKAKTLTTTLSRACLKKENVSLRLQTQTFRHAHEFCNYFAYF
jgi:hypothetical protein